MTKTIGILSAIGMAVLVHLSGCIKNDLPYPAIQQNITSISVQGQSRDALIDSLGLYVTLYLEETTDIRHVKFDKFSVSPGGEADVNLLEGTYDLTHPLQVAVTRYQTYNWEIKAEQNIERYFEIEGQIGESVIDATACRVIVSVPEDADLSHLELKKVKLGPEGITTITPSLSPGTLNLTYPYRVEVSYHGYSEFWTIYAEKTELLVSTSSVDAWSKVIWAYGECPSDMKGGFRYRKADADQWIDVPASEVTQIQGSFSCCIPHLEPLTEYVVRAVADNEQGNDVRVITEATADLPDGDFEQWWLKDNKIWCPWPEDGTSFWDTGNTGAATLGKSNVFPSDHTPTGTGKAAELNTVFVGIMGIGKMAAGSIYTGSFKKVDGTNGILDFGRPWNLRPTKLKGFYQYKTATIDYAATEMAELKGRPDSCYIYIVLADWTAPFEIRTNPKNRQLIDKNSPSIIGYGEFTYSGTMDDYASLEIPIDYRSTSRVPTYMLICCASSKWGDYFTGGTGAVLYVDEFSLDYDY